MGFSFGDGLLGSSVSSVDRVLKRHPDLKRFVTDASPMPGDVDPFEMRRVPGIPVSGTAAAGVQYPIGDADRWQRIVENLAALVVELERTFVPAIEQAAGPSPEWYRPES